MKSQHANDLPPEGGSHATLADGLRAVAEDDERLGASNAVGMRLFAEVQAIAEARRRRAVTFSLAAAAAILAALAVPAWRTLQVQPDTAVADVPVVTRELVTEFFPLRYSNVPARGGYVVRMQVPRTALASFGATPPAGVSNDPNILADVVVGDDGLARAVRFVQVIHGNPADAGLHEQEQTP